MFNFLQNYLFNKISLNSFLIIFLMAFFFPSNNVYGQFQIRDVYGNKLPTPSWPPPDSLFEDDKFIIWFNRDVTNKQFINDNWFYHYNPPTAIGGNNNTIQSYFSIPGCFDVDLAFLFQLLKDTSLVNFLHGLDLEQFCQVSNFMPIQDSLSFTRNGDTILTPEFWNCYEITLSEESPYTPVQCVQFLNYLYGGNQISYAELSPKTELHDCDFDNSNPPNDIIKNQFNEKSCFFNDEESITKRYYQNIFRAWSLAPALPEVKVAVIDVGVTNRFGDLTNNLVDNYKADPNDNTYLDTKPELHGSCVAGIISNKINNTFHSYGVAGGCSIYDGASLYNIKLPFFIDENNSENNKIFTTKDICNGWLYAIKSTDGFDKGFNVNTCNLSLGFYEGNESYSETMRRVLDFAYRLNVINVISAGNAEGTTKIAYPANYENNKIICVGSYAVLRQDPFDLFFDYDFFFTKDVNSSFGSSLDLLAFGQTDVNPKLKISGVEIKHNNSLFGATSAAAPQITGMVALMISKIIEDEPENIDLPLVPEDYESLLKISASDCRFNNTFYFDTTGYDERTGYGILKADTCLMFMENPYILRHFNTDCGDCEDELVEEKQEFIVIDNDVKFDGLISLAPTSKDIQYVADRYRVSKTISIGDLDIDDGLIKARIWGLGGKEPGTNNRTIGWNGVQPRTNVNSFTVYNDEGGYCRVVGDSDEGDLNFNHNNLRDIAYRNNLSTNDIFTIETFVYEVFSATISMNGDVTVGNSIDFFPCEPEDVIYRFSVWGEVETGLKVEKESNNINTENEIKVRCETLELLNNNILSVYYSMGKFEPVEISVYDLKGNKLKTERKHTWNNQTEQKVYIELNYLNSGIYLIEVKSNSGYGSTKFTYTK